MSLTKRINGIIRGTIVFWIVLTEFVGLVSCGANDGVDRGVSTDTSTKLYRRYDIHFTGDSANTFVGAQFRSGRSSGPLVVLDQGSSVALVNSGLGLDESAGRLYPGRGTLDHFYSLTLKGSNLIGLTESGSSIAPEKVSVPRKPFKFRWNKSDGSQVEDLISVPLPIKAVFIDDQKKEINVGHDVEIKLDRDIKSVSSRVLLTITGVDKKTYGQAYLAASGETGAVIKIPVGQFKSFQLGTAHLHLDAINEMKLPPTATDAGGLVKAVHSLQTVEVTLTQ